MRSKPQTPTKTKSPPSSRSDEIEPPLKKPGGRNGRSFLFYGPSGTGKTTLVGTFPKPILYLDIRDKGTDSISEYPEGDIDVWEIDSWDDLEDAYLWISKKENRKKYKTVALDTVTQLQQIAVEHVVAQKKKRSSKVAGDWGTMTMREWGDVSSMLKQYFASFRDLPLNVVFLAQQRVFNVDEDNDSSDNPLLPEVGARLSPATKAALNADVDVIGSTFIRRKIVTKEINGKKVKRERSEYCLRVGPNPVYDSKVRKPKGIEIPPYISNPDYEQIMSIIKGEA